MDFEQVAIQAARNVSGEHLNMQGFFCHLCQNIYRKLQELKLKNKYNNDNVFFSHYYNMIDGLAILPVHKVIGDMKYLNQFVRLKIQT